MWWANLFKTIIVCPSLLLWGAGQVRALARVGPGVADNSDVFFFCCWRFHLNLFMTYDKAVPQGKSFRIVPKSGGGVLQIQIR